MDEGNRFRGALKNPLVMVGLCIMAGIAGGFYTAGFGGLNAISSSTDTGHLVTFAGSA
jgi:hypothetical protein